MLGKVLGPEYEGTDSAAIETLEGELKAFLPSEQQANGETLDNLERSRIRQGGEEESCQEAGEESTSRACSDSRDKA